MPHSATHRTGAFVAAVTAVFLIAGTFAMFVQSYPGQVADEQTMQTISVQVGNDVPTSGWLGDHQLAVLAALVGVITAVCVGRRSTRLAAHAGLIVVGSTLAAVALKLALDRPSMGVGATVNSFPSNTVAVFSAAAFAMVAVCTGNIRRLVGVTALTGVGVVSIAVVALQWHRPSDVIGGWLVAAAAAFAAECLLPVRSSGRRRSAQQKRTILPHAEKLTSR